MKNRIPAVLAGLVAVGLASGAVAKEQAMTFETFDVDGNGRISATEAAKVEALASQMAMLDTDSDGNITREEFKKMRMAEAGSAKTGAAKSTDKAKAGERTRTAEAPAGTKPPATATTPGTRTPSSGEMRDQADTERPTDTLGKPRE